MTFSESAFSGCLHNPMKDDFWLNSENLMGLGPEQVMKYIICMYDPRSPLRREYTDMIERMQVASEIAGFNEEQSQADYTEPIVGYLVLVKSRKWASIIAIEMTIWELIGKLVKPIEVVGAGADKDKLSAVNMKPDTAQKLVELNDLLDAELLKFFDNDAELLEKASQKPMRFSAESIAMMLKKK